MKSSWKQQAPLREHNFVSTGMNVVTQLPEIFYGFICARGFACGDKLGYVSSCAQQRVQCVLHLHHRPGA